MCEWANFHSYLSLPDGNYIKMVEEMQSMLKYYRKAM